MANLAPLLWLGLVLVIIAPVLSEDPYDWLWKCDDTTPDLCKLSAPEEGTVDIRGLQVRYWRYRARKPAASPDKLPIVVIHGGPAQSHDYLLPLKQQACRGREVIFYDQAGCGRSDWPSLDSDLDQDYPWLVDPSYYALIELPTILKSLGVERYHIFAHSWGTVIAQLFALEEKPSGLVSMILSGPLSDARIYNEAQLDPEDGTVRSLPPYVQKRLLALEAEEAYHTDEYQAIDGLFSVMFTSLTVGTNVIPDCVQDTFERTNWYLYDRLWGPSEVRIHTDAALYGVRTTDRLKEIKTPVFLTSAKWDLMTPKVVKPFKENIPNVEFQMFMKSAHASMVDEPGPMNDAIADFVGRMESLGAAGIKTILA